MKELIFSPDERLRLKSEPVHEFGSALKDIVEDMTWVMRSLAGNGIGISAIQTGVALRAGIVELNYLEKKKGKPFFLANPVILSQEGMGIESEGCLSYPGKFYKLKRPTIIWLKYQDQEGHEQKRFFHQMIARCILHEMDHFDGVLFTDRAKEQGIEVIQ